VLALPALAEVRGRSVALVTAPGGRGLIAPTLAKRGARVLRADVYERVPVAPSPQARARLDTLRAPVFLGPGSGAAPPRPLDALPAALRAKLRRARVLAASERLAEQARASGFDDVVVAADARPRSLLAAAARGRIPRYAPSDSTPRQQRPSHR